MLPDNDGLKALIDAATPGDWGIGNHGTHEVQAGGILIADCGTVDRAEADARLMARAKVLAEEVLRLRAQLAPYTDPSPAAQLRRYREAKALVDKPPKVAGEWEPTERKGWWMRPDVRRVGVAFAGDCGNFYADTSGRESVGAPSLEAAKKAADEALTAAGWQLVTE